MNGFSSVSDGDVVVGKSEAFSWIIAFTEIPGMNVDRLVVDGSNMLGYFFPPSVTEIQNGDATHWEIQTVNLNVILEEPHGGGLAAFDTSSGFTGGAYDASNAPVAGLRVPTGYDGPLPIWSSTFLAVGAVDERVWAGKRDGSLVTVSQRWQQLDQSNQLDEKAIRRVWTERGRTFLATDNSLHVLQPDGISWENWDDVVVHSVFAIHSIGFGWAPMPVFGGIGAVNGNLPGT